MRSSAPIALLLALAVSGGCSCEEAATAEIPAEIALRAGPGADAAPIDALDFGAIPLGATGLRTFAIHSLQSSTLEVGALRFEDGPEASDVGAAAAFSADPPGPVTVAGSSATVITVAFTPSEVKNYRATLIVESSDPERPSIAVPLTAAGSAGTLRAITCYGSTELEPERCRDTQVEAPAAFDFGRVVQNQLRTAQLTLFNDGAAALAISSIAFEDPERAEADGFALASDVSRGVTIPAGQSEGPILVELRPTSPQPTSVAAALILRSDDPATPELRVPLTAEVVPNTAPLACVYVRAVRHRDGSIEEFAPGDPVPTIQPLEQVFFDAQARAGCSGDAEDGIVVAQTWSLEGPAAVAGLQSVPGEPFQRSLELEEPGSYVVRLAITDSLGLEGTTDESGAAAEIRFEVQPRQDIGVYLVWPDDRFVDLDLHFVRPGGTLWDGPSGGRSDCHWDNPEPNWGDPATRTDDPLLAIDDVGTGNLLENVELNTPAPGDYQVYVHFYQDNRVRTAAADCRDDADCATQGDASACSSGKCMKPVQATLRLFLESEEVDLAAVAGLTNPRPLSGPCSGWLAGMIRWPTQAARDAGVLPTFLPLDTSLPTGEPTGTTCNQ